VSLEKKLVLIGPSMHTLLLCLTADSGCKTIGVVFHFLFKSKIETVVGIVCIFKRVDELTQCIGEFGLTHSMSEFT